MKEKILAQLKTKYAGVQTSLLGLVADKLSATVTEDSAIEGALANLEQLPVSITDFAKMLQTEGDRRATEAATTRETSLKEKFNFTAKQAENPLPATPPANEGNDETAKAIQQLKAELDAMKQKEIFAGLKSKAAEALKTKKVPEKFFDSIIASKEFKTDEEVNGVVETIATNWTDFQQELVDKGLSGIPKPAFGNPNQSGISAGVEEYVKSKSETQALPLGGKTL